MYSVIPASSRLSGRSPLAALRRVLRAIFGAMNDVAAGIATSMNFDAADTSAAATADTTTVLTEATTNSAAAAGSVASSFSAGSQ